MLPTCPQCGAISAQHTTACALCEAPLAQRDLLPEAVAVASSQPEWRLEVARKLQAYRVRRGRPRPASWRDSQPALPFGGPEETEPQRRWEAAAPAAPRARRNDRVEIRVYQPELDFSAGDDRARPETALARVAPLRARFRAGLCDAGFLLLAYGAFLALFAALGGHFAFGKLNAAIHAAAFLLFYTQYFALFTAFAGATPGMRLCRLYVSSFDGNPPTMRQMLWRSFGYLLAAGVALLGFLWSLWDEDRLTWQDRISQTYIARVEELQQMQTGKTRPV